MASRALKAGLMALGLALLTGGGFSSAMAANMAAPYFPPEMAYADDLRNSITVSDKVNINEDGMNQLKILPGFNEELALKVMRSRPFEGIQDFYRKMPGLSKKNIDLLIQQVQPKLLFK